MKTLLIIILVISTCLFLYSCWEVKKKMYPPHWYYIKKGTSGILPIAVLAISGTFFTITGAFILIALIVLIEFIVYYRHRHKKI